MAWALSAESGHVFAHPAAPPLLLPVEQASASELSVVRQHGFFPVPYPIEKQHPSPAVDSGSSGWALGFQDAEVPPASRPVPSATLGFKDAEVSTIKGITAASGLYIKGISAALGFKDADVSTINGISAALGL